MKLTKSASKPSIQNHILELTTRTVCHVECDSLRLRTVMQHANSCGILNHTPPYSGISFDSILQKSLRIRFPGAQSCISQCGSRNVQFRRELVRVKKMGCENLDLEDFSPSYGGRISGSQDQ